MKKIFILFGFGILILSTGVFAKGINLHCAKDSEFDLTDVNKNDSIHDYIVTLDLDDQGHGDVLFFRYQNYPNKGPLGKSFNTSGHDREHGWFKMEERSSLGNQLYLWKAGYNVYSNNWALNRKTLELFVVTAWAGYAVDYDKAITAAKCRVIDSNKVNTVDLGKQIRTFHKEFLERQKEKARKEAEEREADFTI